MKCCTDKYHSIQPIHTSNHSYYNHMTQNLIYHLTTQTISLQHNFNQFQGVKDQHSQGFLFWSPLTLQLPGTLRCLQPLLSQQYQFQYSFCYASQNLEAQAVKVKYNTSDILISYTSLIQSTTLASNVSSNMHMTEKKM